MPMTRIQKGLRVASLALRSCFSVNASSIPDFVSLRDNMSNSACVYKLKVLPLSRASLQTVKNWMEYFLDLSFEDCKDCAEEILQDAIASKELMILNKDTHKAMAVEFGRLEDRVDKVLGACRLEAKRHEEQAKALRDKADTQSKWAIGLAFIPVVGLIASPILASAADDNLIEAVAAQEEAELAVAAASVVKETLAPALNEYCFAMDRCAGEFEKLASECASFADKGKRFAETEKRAFFKLMQGRATAIFDSVKAFQMVAISAEIDLECLPAAPEPNYVQQWLAQARASQPSFAQRILGLRNKIPCLKEVAE